LGALYQSVNQEKAKEHCEKAVAMANTEGDKILIEKKLTGM
jgi:hypothetical protein